MRVLVTGGTGFIGQALIAFLSEQNHEVTVLTRQSKLCTSSNSSKINFTDALDSIKNDCKIEGIINLAGEPIADKRWSDAQKDRLLQSRVRSTDDLISLVRRLATRPHFLISASAIGYYGAQGDENIDEDSDPNDEFTHHLCRRWEDSALQARDQDVRVCIIRLGVVLGQGGGALGKMLPAFRLGLGGKLGNGVQQLSWVHRDDVISAIDYLMQQRHLSGAFNVTAPNPVANAEFTKMLGRTLSRPTRFAMPGAVVKLLFGEMGDRLLLHGQRVIPKRLIDSGFPFKYEHLEQALQASL